MRSELKYLVREADRERLLSLISPFVQPDPHASPREDGRVGYTVRSIYFDTPGLRDWAEKESGDQVRRKLRVRGYDANDSSPVVLEIKRK
ncbi:MAG: VTC domain-containing protein, partial [Bacteroidota bacterium]